MPELPEVETVVAGLRNAIVGQKIVRAELLTRQLLRINPPDFGEVVAGKTIETVRRKGKQILIELSNGLLFWVHFMMTGKLRLLNFEEQQTKFDGAVFELQPLGKKLVFYDQRRFGRLRLLKKEGLSRLKEYTRSGPDALDISSDEFVRLLKLKKRMLKPLLMDQSVVAGLGNIYVDESLFEAKLHPAATSSRLSERMIRNLYRAVQKVLHRAIKAGGSSIRDYSGVDGKRGYFQIKHKVYRKTDQPCPRCGAKIKRTVIGQRSTHFCPRCQRK